MSFSTTNQIAAEVKEDRLWKSNKKLKMVAMYFAMVAVSTCAIYLLEHATLLNAFRTALVAAVGKTFAATWVSGIFD